MECCCGTPTKRGKQKLSQNDVCGGVFITKMSQKRWKEENHLIVKVASDVNMHHTIPDIDINYCSTVTEKFLISILQNNILAQNFLFKLMTPISLLICSLLVLAQICNVNSFLLPSRLVSRQSSSKVASLGARVARKEEEQEKTSEKDLVTIPFDGLVE